ncbi:MAG TPA: hypothetical protein VHB47_03495 [Thermoanaerobaculia bacterium]|jgi:hypothetical protein|nr:hypothetical protein [Thermoanaerobaculia bacterium]
MTKYLYTFGYFTPAQWLSNEAHGWDDESSMALLIVADSSEQALEWGRKLSEEFVERLFSASGWTSHVPGWRASRFAHWIEAAPEIVSAVEGSVPTIEYGRYLDFGELLKGHGL